MFPNRTIYFGDNLGYLQKMPDEYLDGICIDPPFNSGSNYSNFQDDNVQWAWNDERIKELELLAKVNPKAHFFLKELDRSNPTRRSYLVFMALRLCEIHRILMEHGSLFLICDDAEVEYLKVLLDMIFGWKNKLNLINYRRSFGRTTITVSALKRSCGYILFYAKNKDIYKIDQKAKLRPLTKKELEERYPNIDSNGNRYYLDTVTNVYKPITNFYGLKRKWAYNDQRLEQMIEQGKLVYINKLPGRQKNTHIVLTSGKHIEQLVDEIGNFAVYQKEYPKESNSGLSVLMDNCWDDVKPEQASLAENGGNSGGKTEELIERCLKFFNVPDKSRPVRVLDAFLGFGTTAIIAEKLGYEWIGIDNSKPNIEVTKSRFKGDLVHAKEYIDIDEPVDQSVKQLDLLSNSEVKEPVKKVAKTSFPDIEINVIEELP